ncbi:hypothetical protein OG21DRAFT_383425 [Imleria badia]|nr:hypothetical protein OG21DRAFT_383425 [Imleria badia]
MRITVHTSSGCQSDVQHADGLHHFHSPRIVPFPPHFTICGVPRGGHIGRIQVVIILCMAGGSSSSYFDPLVRWPPVFSSESTPSSGLRFISILKLSAAGVPIVVRDMLLLHHGLKGSHVDSSCPGLNLTHARSGDDQTEHEVRLSSHVCLLPVTILLSKKIQMYGILLHCVCRWADARFVLRF